MNEILDGDVSELEDLSDDDDEDRDPTFVPPEEDVQRFVNVHQVSDGEESDGNEQEGGNEQERAEASEVQPGEISIFLLGTFDNFSQDCYFF